MATETPTPVRLVRSRKCGSKLTSPNGLPVVCVTRPGRWGNPFVVGKVGPLGRKPPDALGAVGFFTDMLRDEQMRAAAGYPSVSEIRSDLAGKNLACWCESEPCHASVLLELANANVPAPSPSPSRAGRAGGVAGEGARR